MYPKEAIQNRSGEDPCCGNANFLPFIIKRRVEFDGSDIAIQQ